MASKKKGLTLFYVKEKGGHRFDSRGIDEYFDTLAQAKKYANRQRFLGGYTIHKEHFSAKELKGL